MCTVQKIHLQDVVDTGQWGVAAGQLGDFGGL